ncbi:uncharacterized protein LOC131668983 [Phymastichus coffea]|uniref:uncharacterized protein LOC131668983 n=1 Tax=Phymastichus coffea TaxID=108790 RepID=UPI00273C69F3|nr:uncharacterized protein LOC131668983 [Phymastichus coffea]
MNYLWLIFYFSCYYTSTLAERGGNTYFNSTAHALRVYGHSFYNPMTLEPLQGVIEDDKRLPFSLPKIKFRGLPCACVDMSCGCCAGLNISTIKFDRRYCANFTFDPANFEVDMMVMMNENEIFKTSLSARNPPPVCVPLPYVPVLDFCLRLYDLSLQDGNNLHTCIDFEARLTQSPLLVMHFNCIRVGPSGISWTKPGNDSNTNGMSISYNSSSMSQQEHAIGVYDPVSFETADKPNDRYSVNTISVSPNEEDKIGEHRISRLYYLLFNGSLT